MNNDSNDSKNRKPLSLRKETVRSMRTATGLRAGMMANCGSRCGSTVWCSTGTLSMAQPGRCG